MNNDTLHLMLTLIPLELWNTCYMVIVSAAIAITVGLPIGALLSITAKGAVRDNRFYYGLLSTIVNIGRSIPFAILMIALIPFTRWVVGSSLGTTAAIVPLSIAAAPFFARITESAFMQIDKSLIEAATVMGSTPWQIITKVLLPESFSSLISGGTTLIVNLIGYSAMAGTMGGGGLGKVAIQYGYQRWNPYLMLATVIILIILVQLIQRIGSYSARCVERKIGCST